MEKTMKIKSLLIVYKEKDEEYFEYLKNLIDTNDDDKDIVGTKDGTIRVMMCLEKTWLSHKEKGTSDKLADKTIFIDDIQGVSLENTIFDDYGIKYGLVDDNSFSIIVDEKYEWSEEKYNSFYKEIQELSILQIPDENIMNNKKDRQDKMKKHKALFILGVMYPLAFGAAGAIVGGTIAADAMKDSKLLRKQMLYYAINKVYIEELNDFMN